VLSQNGVLYPVAYHKALGPIFFLVYVNDLDNVLRHSVIYKFADDTKIVSVVNTYDDAHRLQEDIGAIEAWSAKWKMPFNSSKTAVVHFGKTNSKFSYTMNGTTICTSDVERDLGVQVDAKLNFETHINSVVSKAQKLCGWIRRVYTTRNITVLLKLYTTIVRPVLEYACIIWSPAKRALVSKIEKVQRHYTKGIRSIKHLSYKDRLRVLNICSLEERRNIIDIRNTYNMLFSKFSHLRALFRLRHDGSNRRLRGHSLQLAHVRCRTALRLHFCN
jgi:hypothetical protein